MSGDVMEFPRTSEEFCGQYSFFDKDEVYTNGSLLIPVFRVEQMVEHYFGGKVGKMSCYSERTCNLIEDGDSLHCSNCGGGAEKQSWAYWRYCPNCGSRVIK